MSRPSIFRRQTHPDHVVYVVYVLWMIGHTQRTIGAVLGLRKTQVAGIIDNSDYKGRANMRHEEIVEKLAELKAIRFGDDGQPLDRGRLDRIGFVPRRLDPRQYRGAGKRNPRNA